MKETSTVMGAPMRLYLKLMVMIFAFVMLQRGMEGRFHDLWFACRCSYAWYCDDLRMQDRLIEEARLEMFRHGEEVLMRVAAARGG